MTNPNVGGFGTDIRALGYVKVQTNDIERWRTFAFDVLGFAQGSGPDPDALYLRVDERAARIVVVPGETDEVVTVGWEVRDHAALVRVKEAVERAGIAVKPLSLEEADARRVEEVITFQDPAGTTLEVFHGAVLDHSPVVTPFGAKFVTGAQGLGHVVLPTMDPNGTFDFYTDVLGFLPRGAFRIPAPPEFGPLRVRFLGVNQRHHSLALCPAPHGGAPGLVHIMVEVDTLDAVGQAARPRDEGRFLGVLDAGPPHQRQDGVLLRPRPRCLGHRVRHRRQPGRRGFYTSEEITADSYWGHDWSGSEPLAAM